MMQKLELPPKGFAVGPVSEPTVPCCLSLMHVLAHCHEEPGRDWTVYAVSSFTQLATRRNSQMPKIEREAILSLQGPVWGDDELLAGLHDIASQTDRGPVCSDLGSFAHHWVDCVFRWAYVESALCGPRVGCNCHYGHHD